MGKQVRIAGFMGALRGNMKGYEVFTNPEIANIGKFILVPGMGMCTHVPPPSRKSNGLCSNEKRL
jgi:hypothetical protein